jgi:hypothetical protein
VSCRLFVSYAVRPHTHSLTPALALAHVLTRLVHSQEIRSQRTTTARLLAPPTYCGMG